MSGQTHRALRNAAASADASTSTPTAARQTSRDQLDRLVDIVGTIAERVERELVEESRLVFEPD